MLGNQGRDVQNQGWIHRIASPCQKGESPQINTMKFLECHTHGHFVGKTCPKCPIPAPTSPNLPRLTPKPPSSPKAKAAKEIEPRRFEGLTLTIKSRIMGGKNNMIVTRSGRHYPKPTWAKWRDATVSEVSGQLPRNWKPINKPMNITLHYVAGDKRRRDMPAIIDSIYHVLEKAGVVEDDQYLWIAHSTRGYDKANPMARIEFPADEIGVLHVSHQRGLPKIQGTYFE